MHPSTDSTTIRDSLQSMPDTESVASFVPSADIRRLDIRFDVFRLRTALSDALGADSFIDQGSGFHALPLTMRPGQSGMTDNDLSGRYTMRRDESYEEVDMEEIVDEAGFSQFNPAFSGTYFETVYRTLTNQFVIGRMRVLMKDPYNCNSWHRDPEPRLHIPITTNPGSLFIVNHHCTHLPADGSVYFTDTRGYHTALNGGPTPRVHIVAALPLSQNLPGRLDTRSTAAD